MASENERLIVLDILTAVLDKKQYSHLVIRQALNRYGYLPDNSRAFIERLSLGVLEKRFELDAVINAVSSVRVEKQKPVIRNILRMTVYQLKYMNVPEHAAVSESVRLCRKKGFAGLTGFVNGVSRNIARKLPTLVLPETDSIRTSLPEWLCESIHSWYPEETAARYFDALAKGGEHQPLTVHIHKHLAKEEDILSSLAAEHVICTPAPYADDCYELAGNGRPDALTAWKNGWIQIQDLGSALAAQAAAVSPGEQVLDLCAAPGSKSIYMAEAMNQTGMVVSRDVSAPRLEFLHENLERTGLTNVRTQCADASVSAAEDKEQFDCVLADVPCSGLGVLLRKPDIRYQLTADRLPQLEALQKKILDHAMEAVRPGGRLVYSTCTINPGENEAQARYILNTGAFCPVPVSEWLHKPVEGISADASDLQLIPGLHACDGFYIAVFRKQPA